MDNIEKLQLLPASNDLSADVRTILTEARRSTARAINTTMTTAYWLIGKRIVIEEQKGAERAAYGEGLLKKLSKELTADFGNGFSYENLKKMRQFYKTYTDEKGYTLCIQLPWSHNRLIMKVADAKAREWYLREAAREGWSVRQLERNINSFYYQRQLENGIDTNENTVTSVGKSSVIDVRQFVKDPYVLEFVGLPAGVDYKEKELKRGADDNPTIGILMCAERDETIVKYSVLSESKQIFASKYLPYLPTEEELKRELENSKYVKRVEE